MVSTRSSSRTLADEFSDEAVLRRSVQPKSYASEYRAAFHEKIEAERSAKGLGWFTRPFVYLWDIYYVNTPTGGLEGWEQPAFHIVSVLMLAVALMGFYKSAMVLRPVARLLLSGVLQTLDDLTCVAQRRWNGFGFGWGAIGCSAKRSGEGLASFEGSSLTATLARGVALVALATAAAVASMRLAEARPRRTRQRQPNLRRRA